MLDKNVFLLIVKYMHVNIKPEPQTTVWAFVAPDNWNVPGKEGEPSYIPCS